MTKQTEEFLLLICDVIQKGEAYENVEILFNKLAEICPQDLDCIMEEKADAAFLYNRKSDAMALYYKCYCKNHRKELFDKIIEQYLGDVQTRCEKYAHNLELLKSTGRYYCQESEELKYYLLWKDEQQVFYSDLSGEIVRKAQQTFDFEKISEGVWMIVNELFLDVLFNLEEKTRMKEPFMDEQYPLYLQYELAQWQVFVQEIEEADILKLDRVFYFIGPSAGVDYFVQEGSMLPNLIFGENIRDYSALVQKIEKEREESFARNKQIVKEYYSKNDKKILENIKRRDYKILFITTRFSTALQYHVRDCRIASERLGISTDLMIEKDNYSYISEKEFTTRLAEFKPDIIFMLDHFRYEIWKEIPDSIVWICWAQDPMPHILSVETPAKLIDRDVVISEFGGWEEFDKVPYDPRRMIHEPLVASSQLYRAYQLSEEERKEFECDICMVCHSACAKNSVNEILENYSESASDFVQDALESYIEYSYTINDILYGRKNIADYFSNYWKEKFGEEINQEVEMIADQVEKRLNPSLFRQMLADWLIEAGYENIKLWGRGWLNNEKHKKYAMGAAQNGETLSKILQASKIVVGNNCALTGASRVAETMLSGAFYLGNYIPRETDFCDIRKWLQVDKDIIMFSGKEDFLQKIDYYLTHEEERRRKAEEGRKKALELLTYDGFMKHSMNKLQEMF